MTKAETLERIVADLRAMKLRRLGAREFRLYSLVGSLMDEATRLETEADGEDTSFRL